jgi:glycosyltransferase involved in cell wall biosynthesis
MNLAYFVNQYPKVSHSFIRREILMLEALGIPVQRFSLRSDQGELVDILDREEFTKTRYLLSEPLKIIMSAMKAFVTKPINFIKTLVMAIRMGYRSDRGMLRHCIYFLESCMLLEWEKSAQITHIHSHFGTNSTTVVMLAYLMGGAGYSFTVHGPEEFDKPEFIHLTEKINHARFVVAISSFGRSQLWRLLPASQWQKVEIVHCGLDDAFLNAKKVKKPVAKDQFVCVGRLCEQKGQLLLLDAMRQLRDEGVRCKLILAGDGPMRKDCEAKISAYQLADDVTITGWISGEQVKELLLASNCMVLPSFAEGLPVVIMEALALRRPVISTYVAGIPELIEPGKTGWLVPAGDVESLKIAMKSMLTTPQAELEAMGNKGFEAVMAQHNIETEALKLAALFAGVTS